MEGTDQTIFNVLKQTLCIIRVLATPPQINAYSFCQC